MSAFNKTGICWCDYTFNPLTGCWGPQGTQEKPNHCPYCYARAFAKRGMGRYKETGFTPTVHLDRFEQEPPKGQHRIFVCSMGDPCGDWDWKPYNSDPYEPLIPPCLIQARLWRYIEDHPRHQFILLTKNPAGLERSPLKLPVFHFDLTFYDDLPSNLVWGISLTGDNETSRKRLETYLDVIRPTEPKLISLEPCLGPCPPLPEVEPGMGWLIIGAQTGPGAEKPDLAEIERAIHNAQVLGWSVWTKNNVIAQFPRHTLQREPWPREQLVIAGSASTGLR